MVTINFCKTLACYNLQREANEKLKILQMRDFITILTAVPKYQNYPFKLKFDAKTNSNMQNSMLVFIFSVFWLGIPILGKFGQKNQNY